MARKKYERQHRSELYCYDFYRAKIKDAIACDDKKITPTKWRRELADLKKAYNKTQKPYAQTVWKLAAISVLIHNKKDLERMIENERGRQRKSPEKHRDNVR